MMRALENPILPMAMLVLMVMVITFFFTFYWPENNILLVTAVLAGAVVIPLAMMYPQIMILVLVALVPLNTFDYLAESMQMLTFTKILFPLALFGLLLGRLAGRFGALAPDSMDKWVFLWIALNAVLVIDAVDMEEALTFVRRLISMGLFYYVISRTFGGMKWNHRLQITIIWSAVVSVVVGMIIYAAGQNPFLIGYEDDLVRITGAAYTSPNMYSILLLLPLMLVLLRFFSTEVFHSRLIWLGLALLLIFGVVFTFSRSGFLSFAASLLFVPVVWKHNASSRQWTVLIIILLIIGLLIPGEFWQRIGSLNVFSDDAVADASLLRRFNYLRVGATIFGDHPFLGAGPGNYQTLHAMAEYQTTPTLIGVERMPHNMYLQSITETGIIGFSFLLIMLSTIISRVVRIFREQNAYRGLAGALMLCLLGNLVMGVFSHQFLNKYLWVLFAMIRMLPETRKNAGQTPHPGFPAT